MNLHAEVAAKEMQKSYCLYIIVILLYYVELNKNQGSYSIKKTLKHKTQILYFTFKNPSLIAMHYFK